MILCSSAYSLNILLQYEKDDRAPYSYPFEDFNTDEDNIKSSQSGLVNFEMKIPINSFFTLKGGYYDDRYELQSWHDGTWFAPDDEYVLWTWRQSYTIFNFGGELHIPFNILNLFEKEYMDSITKTTFADISFLIESGGDVGQGRFKIDVNINLNDSFSLLTGYYNDRYEIAVCNEEIVGICYSHEAEYLPEVEGIYYFGINYRKSFFNTNNIISVNPNGHPFSLNFSILLENPMAVSISSKIPINDWLSLSGGFYVDRYRDGSIIGTPEAYNKELEYLSSSLIWYFGTELHLPLFK